MSETLHGQGTTLERKQKSSIVVAPRVLTKGGMTITFGEHDTEHCTLDWLLNEDYIEQDQYDAGIHLRALYYTFTQTGRHEINDGGQGHEGEFATPQDDAYEKYRKAIIGIRKPARNLTEHICTQGQSRMIECPALYGALITLQGGLDDLINPFHN
jgi:hypothetical protein